MQLVDSNLPNLITAANTNLKKLENWFAANRLTINASKTKFILYHPKNAHIHPINLYFDNTELEQIGSKFKTTSFKFLGHLVNDTLNWSEHISKIENKCKSAIFALARTKNFLPISARRNIYNSLVKSHIDFGSVIYGCAKPSLIKKLTSVQKKAIRHVSAAKYSSHTDPLFIQNNQLKVNDIIRYNNLLFMHSLRYDNLPVSFNNILQLKTENNTDKIRSDMGSFFIPPNFSHIASPLHNAARDWNMLPLFYKSISKPSVFKKEIKSYLISKYNSYCDVINCYSCK